MYDFNTISFLPFVEMLRTMPALDVAGSLAQAQINYGAKVNNVDMALVKKNA